MKIYNQDNHPYYNKTSRRAAFFYLMYAVEIPLNELVLTTSNSQKAQFVYTVNKANIAKGKKLVNAVKRKAKDNNWSVTKTQNALESLTFKNQWQILSKQDIMLSLFLGLYKGQETLLEKMENQNQKQTQLIDELRNLVEMYQKREEKEQEKEAKRVKRKTRNREAQRDPITEKDFDMLKKFIRGSNMNRLNKSRLLVFYTLMFLTGLRIMEAAEATFDITDDLFLIQLMYPKSKQHLLEGTAFINPNKKYLLQDVKLDYNYIRKVSNGEGYIFCRLYLN